MILVSMGDIKNIDGWNFISIQVYAWTQHIDLLPKMIKPNWIGKNSCFIWLYEHASMRDKGRFYHRIEKIEENLKRLAE